MFTYLKEANFKKFFHWIAISSLCGFLAGVAASIFLIFLDWATNTRIAHQGLIFLLPLAGLFIGWVYHAYGKDVAAGNNLILEEIHDPKKVVPLKMAPFILLGTVMTHLFGGSAGREGTAVQMGATLADQLTRPFGISDAERKILLVAGAGAGFGAAIGAPWAGVIFGMEVIYVGRLRLFAFLECFIASFVAYYTAKLLNAPHSHYPAAVIPEFSIKLLLFVLLAGILFGLSAQIFAKFTHIVEGLQKKFIKYPPLKPFVGGIIVVTLFYLEGSYRFAGLGIDVIQKAIEEQSSFLDPLLKGVFTAITIGTGFKGGEFIPLVFIGATLGSALTVILPTSVGFLSALGFAAVFAGASNTPLACTIMAIEIFGPKIAPYALIACYMSYYFSGHHGIYRSQVIHSRKHQRVKQILSLLGEVPKRFINGGK